jgi:pyridoxine 5-phosphate synthase
MGTAVGAGVSCTPFVGLHFLITFALAWALRGNLVAGAVGTAFGNPVTFPVLWAGSYQIGQLLLGRAASEAPGGLAQDLAEKSWDRLWPLIGPITIGAVPLGIAIGCIVFALVYKAVATCLTRTHLRLGVNIDHVATVRNARGGRQPDPVRAALLAQKAGADGITAHLREDRRHITDRDITRLSTEISLPLNLEMAATDEMLQIALRHRPHAACIVPERREERTTEGGLDAAGGKAHLGAYVGELGQAGIRVSLFIEPEPRQLDAAQALGAPVVELHTGAYCDAAAGGDHAATRAQLRRLEEAARYGASIGLEVHAGHGLAYDTVKPVAAIPELAELNIGHFLIGEAIFVGLEESVRGMRALMDEARASAAMAAT